LLQDGGDLNAQLDYSAPLRRIVYRDPATGKALVFMTNNFDLRPLHSVVIIISVY
jgi:hypothetical protein